MRRKTLARTDPQPGRKDDEKNGTDENKFEKDEEKPNRGMLEEIAQEKTNQDVQEEHLLHLLQKLLNNTDDPEEDLLRLLHKLLKSTDEDEEEDEDEGPEGPTSAETGNEEDYYTEESSDCERNNEDEDEGSEGPIPSETNESENEEEEWDDTNLWGFRCGMQNNESRKKPRTVFSTNPQEHIIPWTKKTPTTKTGRPIFTGEEGSYGRTIPGTKKTK